MFFDRLKGIVAANDGFLTVVDKDDEVFLHIYQK